ncbi:MAG: ABC transporter permease [Chitinophagaceae bacterium]|nr:ABC transporter permease [Chitinophagaceae bacterium]
MLKNYLRVALRSFWRNKTFSLINTTGMALGMTFCLLIMLWVQDEKKVDGFHANAKQLFSIYERQFYDNKVEGVYYTPGLLADELKKNIPEIRYATGYGNTTLTSFRAGDKVQKEQGTHAGADFFSMFSYPLLLGKAPNALNDPSAIAISRKMAADFFGSPDAAMGKTIRCNDRKDFIVSAVFENLPTNVSERFDYLINWNSLIEDNPWLKEFGNNSPQTMVMLHPSANPAAVDDKIRHFLDKYNKDQGPGFRIELHLQRFDEKYLNSHFRDGQPDGGRIEYVKLFSLIALFILAIACINFMNLTTARSVKRAKEIGIRKVVGALRGSLIRQFIGEAILLCVMAVLLALLSSALLLPAFNSLTGKQMELPASDYRFWLILAGLTVATGAVAGSYPALLLSSFNPVKVLKGSLKFGTGPLLFRKGLVVFQFVLSIVLIIGTVVVSRQVSFIQSKNIGYDRGNLLYIPLEGALASKYPVFKQQALADGTIESITHIDQAPTLMTNGTGGVEWEGKAPNTMPQFTPETVGYDFVKTMKLQLAAGRDFSKDFPTDTANFILNEAAVEKIGYKNPIGRQITMWRTKGTIVGVIRDFHFNSMHEAIQPLILRLSERKDNGQMLVRIKAGKTREAIASLGALCKTLNPAFPFTYKFSDLEFEKLYKSEQLVGSLSRYFSLLAIFISCLGLLGLVMFTAEQRTKEFGIRKVLGANLLSLFALLSRDFLLLVAIAALIAFPIAWYGTHSWLQAFAYRTEISWWIFILAGLAAVLIALLTVSIQSVKAALVNPVKSLRTE